MTDLARLTARSDRQTQKNCKLCRRCRKCNSYVQPDTAPATKENPHRPHLCGIPYISEVPSGPFSTCGPNVLTSEALFPNLTSSKPKIQKTLLKYVSEKKLGWYSEIWGILYATVRKSPKKGKRSRKLFFDSIRKPEALETLHLQSRSLCLIFWGAVLFHFLVHCFSYLTFKSKIRNYGNICHVWWCIFGSRFALLGCMKRA